ncbi:hypothetical protein [Staphylococcus arlettae]|uniref:hypothetical protein n=1 Tax=Staphylococcus arlettae TaxID=29378 RepID=UPI0021D1E3D5|nr:hypothetical protein [Staphylococcus arlettae]UXU53192.1 hypothetical protein MUA71_03700 [Staphylococcus arlettae]
MIGTIILLICLFISVAALFGVTIYGILYFYTEKEYLVILLFGNVVTILILTAIGVLLMILGI